MTVPAPLLERQFTQPGRPTLRRGFGDRDLPTAPGPWLDEPDKVHWVDPVTDLDCLANRNPMGAWCGYVGVPPGHPWHGLGCGEDGLEDVEVHGGLTFASSCREDERGEAFGICHVPFPGRPDDVWWLGFDCAHAWDLTPWSAAMALAEPGGPWSRLDREVYRDLDYVRAECARLALQVRAAAG